MFRVSMQHNAERLYIVTNADDAYNYKLARCSIRDMRKEHWQDYVGHRYVFAERQMPSTIMNFSGNVRR